MGLLKDIGVAWDTNYFGERQLKAIALLLSGKKMTGINGRRFPTAW